MAGDPPPVSIASDPVRSRAAEPTGVAPAVADDDIRRIGLVTLSVLALVVGVVTGFGAVVFRDLIGLIHNVPVPRQMAVRYDANVFTPPSPWGPFVILVPVIGRPCRYLSRHALCARGARPRRAGGHGRDLLQGRRDPAGRRGGQVAGLGDRDRQRRGGGTRGADHPDRLRPWIDLGPDRAHGPRRAHHPRRRRRRRRHRRDLQHARSAASCSRSS